MCNTLSLFFAGLHMYTNICNTYVAHLVMHSSEYLLPCSTHAASPEYQIAHLLIPFCDPVSHIWDAHLICFSQLISISEVARLSQCLGWH